MLRGALLSVAATGVLVGCARLEFYDRPTEGALTYSEPVSYLLVSTTPDCVSTASVVTLPGRKKSVGLIPGYGSSELSVSLNGNGTIASVGQKTDTKVPETITAVTGFGTAAGILHAAAADKINCKPTANLYRVGNDGAPQKGSAVDWPIERLPPGATK